MVGQASWVLLGTAILGFCHGASLQGKKSIDELMMEAAPNNHMFDFLHLMPDGEAMVMVDLDIMMSVKEYMDYMKKEPSVQSRKKRKALRDENTKWKDRRVYFEFSPTFSGDKTVIREAMDEWMSYTCLIFEPASPNTTDKIHFKDGDGCYSRLGRVGGKQDIGLASGCVRKGIVIHEIGHAIGWIHEQARPDRDNYIRVNFNRIPQSWHSQFEKFPDRLINNYGVQYDYLSIMHYSGNAVATRAIETLDPKYQGIIGRRAGLSYKDIKLANLMYNCAGMAVSGGKCQNEGACLSLADSYLDKNCTCMCPGNDTHPAVACTTLAPTTPTPATTTTTTAAVTTTPKPRECRNIRPNCPQRADSDECRMNPNTMMQFCEKSCGFCEKEVCMDYESSCPMLAVAQFCNESSVFYSIMKTRCRKSCKFCTPTDACQMQRDLGLEPLTAGSRDTAPGPVLFVLTAVLFLSHHF